jgi:hypothetical protein
MIQNWLNLNAPGYEELGPDEKAALQDFSLLWSLFEAQVLNTAASAKSIQDKVNSWFDAGLIEPAEIEQFKLYFVDRYADNGELNYRFDHLHLRRGDKPELVQAVLKGEDDNAANLLVALLIIVLRYRNNFFHGIKWAYGFRGQLENFREANNLLIKVLEINRNA